MIQHIHAGTYYDQRQQLKSPAGSRSLPAGFVQRAKIILLAAQGILGRAMLDALAFVSPRIILELSPEPDHAPHYSRCS